MSDTDSFIDEVTEELRRDQLFKTMRRYGWIAVLLVVFVVGGAAFSEFRKAQARSEAQSLGDSILVALRNSDGAARAAALAAIDPATPQAAIVVQFLEAAEQAEAGDLAAAVASLNALAVNGDTLGIYRQIAQFKGLTLQAQTLPASERRMGFEALAQAGAPLRLLAQEQLALIDLEEGNKEAAISGYQAILSDAEVTADLQQRALQVIVVLGGEPDLGALAETTGLTDSGN